MTAFIERIFNALRLGAKLIEQGHLGQKLLDLADRTEAEMIEIRKGMGDPKSHLSADDKHHF